MKQNYFRIATGLFATTTFAAVSAMTMTARAAAPTSAPTTQPAATGAVIPVADKAALAANMDKDVVVEGVCTEAVWSGSGKVMNLRFEGAGESKFSGAVFLTNREKIDTAFGGDATKAWTGARLRLKGKLKEFKGKPEITISDAAQVTVVEPPTSKPAK